MADEWAELVDELKVLRRKRGLTMQSLATSHRVLGALNNPPLQEAYDALVEQVRELGSDERASALQNAFAIDVPEPGVLTERRARFQQRTGRDPKTIASYEDALIEELASRLLGRRKPEVSESEVVVVGYLRGSSLARLVVSVRFPEQGGEAFERAVEYVNRSTVEQSLPALLYQLPPAWEPKRLTLAVHPGPDRTLSLDFWAAPARELLDLMFASYGGPLPVASGSAAMTEPKVGITYGIYWQPRPAFA